jgi:L-arabinose isomerase
MIDIKEYEVWFVTGSQGLYGEKTLKQVAEDSQKIAAGIDASGKLPVNLVFKPVVTSSQGIHDMCVDANNSRSCIGLVTWMHTFSPAQMWIAGLKSLQKPFLHLHTQFNRDLPWSTIDMDFMNLNQSAHGDREFGFIASRMRLDRKVVVGFWQDDDVLAKIASWIRAACAWRDMQGARVARFGDNMRDVAVTEGDKVEAQISLGFSVLGYGVGELVRSTNDIQDSDRKSTRLNSSH